MIDGIGAIKRGIASFGIFYFCGCYIFLISKTLGLRPISNCGSFLIGSILKIAQRNRLEGFPEMRRFLHSYFVSLLVLIAALPVAKAEDQTTMIHVALLDMSSVMPAGMMGYGMMGPGMMNQGMMNQGMMNQGMMGQGSGMMNPGMGGYSMMGPGMMMGGMMSIRIDRASVKAGSVTFEVTNWSRSVLHEMLIVSVESPSSPLPYDYTAGRVPEEQVKVLGEVEDLEPNASKSIEVTLGAGSYLLICNLAGHFASGMAAPLNVTP